MRQRRTAPLRRQQELPQPPPGRPSGAERPWRPRPSWPPDEATPPRRTGHHFRPPPFHSESDGWSQNASGRSIRLATTRQNGPSGPHSRSPARETWGLPSQALWKRRKPKRTMSRLTAQTRFVTTHANMRAKLPQNQRREWKRERQEGRRQGHFGYLDAGA